MLSYAVTCILLGTSISRANAQENQMAPIYTNNIEFLSNSSNIIDVSLPVLQTALKNPNLTSETFIDGGYDWTKPYAQAVKISGHKARLRIAYDVPIPEEVVHNSTTAVASLSFSVPKAMRGSDGLPKSMDPSWALCRHIYVSTTVDPTRTTAGDSCSFLPPNCASDLRASLTKGWLSANPNVPCSELGFDAIAKSCQESFGLARADVNVYDSTALADKLTMRAMAVDEESTVNWRIGTGYHDKGSKIAYEMASNRTYLIVDVWGYSSKLSGSKQRAPDATLTCLSGKSNYPKFNSTLEPSKSSTSRTHPRHTSKVKPSPQSSSGTRRASLPLANLLGKSSGNSPG